MSTKYDGSHFSVVSCSQCQGIKQGTCFLLERRGEGELEINTDFTFQCFKLRHVKLVNPRRPSEVIFAKLVNKFVYFIGPLNYVTEPVTGPTSKYINGMYKYSVILRTVDCKQLHLLISKETAFTGQTFNVVNTDHLRILLL